MHGLVNRAIKDMVCEKFDSATWATIRAKVAVDTVAFNSMDGYPGEVTYALVGATSEVLGAPIDDLLEAFGEYWTLYTAQEGYGDMIGMFGDNIIDFLRNLDEMHGHISVTTPDLRPPQFSCKDAGDGRYTLHYTSERDGLGPMVVGLLKGLAKRFEIEAKIKHRARKADGTDHDEFDIEIAAWQPDATDDASSGQPSRDPVSVLRLDRRQ